MSFAAISAEGSEGGSLLPTVSTDNIFRAASQTTQRRGRLVRLKAMGATEYNSANLHESKIVALHGMKWCKYFFEDCIVRPHYYFTFIIDAHFG